MMRQMSARFQCFSGTVSLLVLFWDLPPPFFISDPGVRLGGEEMGGGGGLGGGAAAAIHCTSSDCSSS